ncbi:hypothetical protein Acy02nite_22080 [Actinoplanes cyaneus]|uniref:HTH cro/C1-type domain-containing protein n=1 Tax=Actinoplanes cyaneus TaxID=52696 RepID=A0A919M3A4_9ACTN|nr:helix-turn-helix transcriptional regulator [Actinoplanes cyaneus]MCW2136527.1 Transcriptional regulator, contains XRE-family HTH domain [Actinoplanes cyaneus]GID64327.1 hypothetical protein Acy02nite_22080 [Actinoplanes cyaneus]
MSGNRDERGGLASTPSATLTLGQALRELRRRAGISLAELSKRIHYSKSFLSKVENGHQRPSPRLAQLIVEALGGDWSEISRIYLNETAEPRLTLGEELRALRLDVGLSLRAVASEVEYGAASLSDAENGKSVPRWEMVERVVTYLSGDVEKFRRLYRLESAPLDAVPEVSNSSKQAREYLDPYTEGIIFGLLTADVPHSILAAMGEAARLAHSSPTATLALTRSVIEAISTDLGHHDLRASQALGALFESHKIDAKLKSWGDRVVNVANSALHNVGGNSSLEGAREAVIFLTTLVSKIYIVDTGYERFELGQRQ